MTWLTGMTYPDLFFLKMKEKKKEILSSVLMRSRSPAAGLDYST